MKKIYLIIIVLLFNCCAIGQVWVDKGAVWHYDYSNIGYGGFIKYIYTQDSLISGKNCQMISGIKYKFSMDQFGTIYYVGQQALSNQFTYTSGDTVFYWSSNEFFVLYNFGASIGDKWLISIDNPSPGICDDSSYIEVIDTGKITINSVPYRFITVEPTPNSSKGFKGTYVERFGNLDQNIDEHQDLFPTMNQCDSLTGAFEFDRLTFKCFEDSSFSLYNPSSQDCEYLFHIGINEISLHKLLCYPNPTTGLINLDLPNEIQDFEVEIYNINGSLVLSNHNKRNFSLAHLPKGVYILRLLTNDSLINYKIILQ
ncbi:MAG: T9SS type A sorting domain-containing protein [Saprospiraceae bacterium]|nr:T9SS type A sorting domain-containing protein [Saprospiraceae bacterium]